MKRIAALVVCVGLLAAFALSALGEGTRVVVPSKMDKLIDIASFRKGSLLTESDTDYFKTGISSETTVIAYYHQPATQEKIRSTAALGLGKQKTDARGNKLFDENGKPIMTGLLGGNWYYYVEENYPVGDIEWCRAVYNLQGKLVHYMLAYREGETETYTIQYSPEDKVQKGWYWAITEWGEERYAYANSMKTWRDEKTGLLTNSNTLDWGLYPLGGGHFDNPPRSKK